jgi:hypothetical protein
MTKARSQSDWYSINPRLGKRIDLTELLSHRVSIAPRTDLGRSGASPYQVTLT